jgi:hypothetical protein
MKRLFLTVALVVILVAPVVKAQDLNVFASTTTEQINCDDRAAYASFFYAWISWSTMITVYNGVLRECIAGN